MTWTHPYASRKGSDDDRCAWTAGGGRFCQQPRGAAIHQRDSPHPFVDRQDARCGHDVGDRVLCGISRVLPVHQ
jgi:hypothetical protein